MKEGDVVQVYWISGATREAIVLGTFGPDWLVVQFTDHKLNTIIAKGEVVRGFVRGEMNG